jgi:hypothetical protein
MWMSLVNHLSHGYVVWRVLEDSGIKTYTAPNVADAYINMLYAQIFSKLSK